MTPYYVGVSDGQTLKIPVGHSETYVIIRVADSDTFQRDVFDVHSDATISFSQAVLGGTVRIPGLSGTLDVKVSCCVWYENESMSV